MSSRNLFVQLLPGGAAGTPDAPAAHGLSRALTVVLDREPGLVRHLLRCLGLRPRADARRTGDAVWVSGPTADDDLLVPLQLRCDDLLVYIDTHLERALHPGRRPARAPPQLHERRRALHAHLSATAAREGREGALIELSAAALPPPGPELALHRGLRFWWDVSAAMEDWLAHAAHPDADHRVFLAEQLLELMEVLGLDPPAPLDPGRWLPEDAAHLLVMAATGIEGVEAEVTDDGVLHLLRDGRRARLRWGPAGVEVEEEAHGRRIVPQPPRDFWEADLPGQLEYMVGLLRALVEDLWG
jgi:hypothetical protein